MSTPVDLSTLRVGSKVKLRGDVKPQPRKPYPRGWQEVVDVDLSNSASFTFIRVIGDHRWIPVDLIEEIVN